MFDTVPPDGKIRAADLGSPGLFLRRIEGQDSPVITNIKPRLAGKYGDPTGGWLLASASLLLTALAVCMGIVSWHAQYAYVLGIKHQSTASALEALGLDAGAVIFSVLGVALARLGRRAVIERALVCVCAAGSAAMNLGLADLGSPRSVGVYIMPPVLFAITSDRLVSVIRRQALGPKADSESQRSAWRVGGLAALYAVRLIVAPPSTIAGGRRALLNATPVPEPEPRPVVVQAEEPQPAITAPEVPALLMRQVGPVQAYPKTRTHKPSRRRAPRREFASGKTASFLAACAEKHGQGALAGIDLTDVYRISKELAPAHDLHPGSARTALRKAVLAASSAVDG